MARKDSRLFEKPSAPQQPPAHERSCDYCGKGQVGVVNGIAHCREHAWSAMDLVRPMGSVRARA